MGDEWTIYGIEKVMGLSMVWSNCRVEGMEYLDCLA